MCLSVPSIAWRRIYCSYYAGQTYAYFLMQFTAVVYLLWLLPVVCWRLWVSRTITPEMRAALPTRVYFIMGLQDTLYNLFTTVSGHPHIHTHFRLLWRHSSLRWAGRALSQRFRTSCRNTSSSRSAAPPCRNRSALLVLLRHILRSRCCAGCPFANRDVRSSNDAGFHAAARLCRPSVISVVLAMATRTSAAKGETAKQLASHRWGRSATGSKRV
jgi:hypothetical protein